MRWLFACLLLFGSVASVCAAPQIGAEELNYDFGEILQGDKVQYVFRFRNTGDQVLQLGNVRSSCGCTAALLSATRIAPGDLGELRTTFDSASFKGAIHKTITMDTNDPQHSQVSFALRGNVRVELLLEPERVNWGRVEAGSKLSSVVMIENSGTATVTLQAPHVTSPELSAELSGLTLAPGEQVELRISAKFPEQKKRLGGYVIIATDYPNVPQLRVSVSARLASE